MLLVDDRQHVENRLRKQRQEAQQELAAALRADARLLLDHLNGPLGVPDAAILAYGESLGTGLATGLAAVLLGSETRKVLTHAKVPVLVVR